VTEETTGFFFVYVGHISTQLPLAHIISIMCVTKTAEIKKSPSQVIAVTTNSKEPQTNELNFFIGLFAMCKFYEFVLFISETLTFMYFRGIIY